MSDTTQPEPAARSSAGPTFATVLVGVDGSRTSVEAARQAAVLAPDARIRVLAVTWEQGRGANAVPVLSRWHAEDVLARADRDLRELGVRAAVEIVDDADATGRILREAAGHDLLVLGGHARTRTGGILVGSTASAALHRTDVPLLIARPIDDTHRLVDRVLLAVDGSEPSFGATLVTAALAQRHAGSRIMLIAPETLDRKRRHVIAACSAEIRRATGVEPVVLDESGPAHRAIARAASEQEATLVVMGSRGLHGASALRSVSERVGHESPCSVLIARGPVVWP
jgi:nucleotide-binding universal stress UspA family protein